MGDVSYISWGFYALFSLLMNSAYEYEPCRSSFDYMPWYAGKAEIREYLKELNKDRKASP